MGDGGSANDPNNNAQNINSLLGKFFENHPEFGGKSAESGIYDSGGQSVCRGCRCGRNLRRRLEKSVSLVV